MLSIDPARSCALSICDQEHGTAVARARPPASREAASRAERRARGSCELDDGILAEPSSPHVGRTRCGSRSWCGRPRPALAAATRSVLCHRVLITDPALSRALWICNQEHGTAVA